MCDHASYQGKKTGKSTPGTNDSIIYLVVTNLGTIGECYYFPRSIEGHGSLVESVKVRVKARVTVKVQVRVKV